MRRERRRSKWKRWGGVKDKKKEEALRDVGRRGRGVRQQRFKESEEEKGKKFLRGEDREEEKRGSGAAEVKRGRREHKEAER